MDISILRLIHGQILPKVTDSGAVNRVEQLLQLIRCACDLQSEPDTNASELLERLHAFEGLKESILEISQNIHRGQGLAVQDWLLLTYLATFKWVLRDQWDGCYMIIFEAYPVLGQQINKVLGFVEEIPFAEGTTVLERDWEGDGKRPEFEMAALTYVRACSLIGVFGGSRLYEKASDCLAYEKEFLVVVLAGACFKVPAIASRVNIGAWTDSQYDCMKILDNFVHLGETEWG